MLKSFASICFCVCFTVGVSAQTGTGTRAQAVPQAPPTPPASTSAEVLGFYTNITNFIARTAAMVPAEKLTWQPTPEVRSFARLFAHIVDDNNGACSAIAGVTPPAARMDSGNEKDGWAANKMAKADLGEGPGRFSRGLQQGVRRSRSDEHDGDARTPDEDRDAHLQHEPYQRTLRQSSHLPAVEQHGAAVERATRRRAGRTSLNFEVIAEI